MVLIWSFCVIFLSVRSVLCLSIRKEEDTVFIREASSQGDCDPSAIPVMANFDMKRFAGSWYELAKSASGYIDVNDGMWKLVSNNTSNSFLFSGRDNNGHCIRPIKGKIHPEQPPGMLILSYQTYSTHVKEYIRVLFTDYTSIAVVYLCMHHVHKEKEVCHAAGIMGAVWTRHPHVNLSVYEDALRYLELACVHRSVLILRNQVGPCKVDDLGFQIDNFPVPDYCYQPRDLGYCRGNIQRYYYDPKAKTCEAFSFSGCGGNRNNFMSLPECQDSCLSASVKEPICTSVAKCALHCSPCCTEDRNGCVECNCEHVIIDPVVNCRRSPADCPSTCVVKEVNPTCYVCRCHEEEPTIDTPACLEVPAAGDCNEELTRFYYHALTGKCEEFVYTGCKGNKNNFETLEKCADACGGSDTIITMKAVVPYENNGSSKVQLNQWILSSLLLLLTLLLADIS